MPGLLERSIERGLARLLRRIRSEKAIRWQLCLRRCVRPARFGTLRRTTPLSHDFGWDRGTPVDRYYIERFIRANRRDIRGRVLEVRDSTYTRRFGGDLTEQAVLDIDSTNPDATVVADLATADAIPEESFDCIILTQTLQFIYDVRSAIAHTYRILKPSGVLLATVPAISPIIDDDELPYYWRFTAASCAALFGETFEPRSVRVREYGNVLSAIAFLAGVAREELTVQELETHDRRFALVISVRAVKEDAAAVPSTAADVPREA
jgi:SAM-dependent methyltransferase